MSTNRPQMGPGGSTESGAGTSGGGNPAVPNATPPASAARTNTAGDCGCSGNAAAIMPGTFPALSSGSGEASPQLHPAEAVGAGVTAWQGNKRISGLWSINQDRNSWAYIDGVGWKRLSNVSVSGVTALTMLAAHAREKGSAVDYREESDGMLHELYAW